MKTLKENIFSIIFFLTYLIYPMIFIFNWLYWLGDYGCAVLAILMVLYEILYVFRLGKKEGISINRAVANGFLYLLYMPNVFWLWCFINDFFNGYQETAWITGEAIGERYYGFEAIMQDEITLLCSVATFVPYAIYTVAYFTINKRLEKNK